MEKYAENLPSSVTPTERNEFVSTVTLLRQRFKNNEIDYHMVIQKVNSDSSLGDITVRKYKQIED